MRLFKPIIKVVQQRPLTETELEAVFSVNEGEQWWRAIHQLLEVHKADALGEAAQYMVEEKPLASATVVGAWDWLEAFKQDLLLRQKAALDKK